MLQWSESVYSPVNLTRYNTELMFMTAEPTTIMASITLFVWIFSFVIQESRRQHTLTQTPVVETVLVGKTVSVKCKASSDVYPDCNKSGKPCLAWYQQKPGETPKALVYHGRQSYSWTPSRFSGSGSGSDFTLTISGVQPEDTGDYYCQSVHSGDVFTQ
uniref:Ig-like domain-containing protein n=1 Tax=Esox lucius TaxID=8010 RepID=A0AAY5KGD1_ESOLU